MRISKWLLIVALALPISTFAIAPTDNTIVEVGTIVSTNQRTVESDCTEEEANIAIGWMGLPECTMTFAVTDVVTTKGKYTVRGHAAVSVGEKMTRNRGYLLCGEGHTVSSLEPTCYEVMIGITYRE